jgi:hypothetical protein
MNDYPEGPSLSERSGYWQLGTGPESAPLSRDPRQNAELRACAIVDRSLDLPPAALMGIASENVMRVCAWCSSKAAADRWCANRGYTVTHGICPVCEKAALKAVEAPQEISQGEYPSTTSNPKYT